MSPNLVKGPANVFQRKVLPFSHFAPRLDASMGGPLGLRLLQRGWEMVYVPDAVVYHRVPSRVASAKRVPGHALALRLRQRWVLREALEARRAPHA
jgi:hypothetical protein